MQNSKISEIAMGGINAIETESITGGVSVFLVALLNKTPGPPFTH